MIPTDVQGEVAGEVNNRLEKATRELQDKYARGLGGHDQSVDGPSGQAYKEKHAQEMAQKKEQRDQRAQNYENNESSNNTNEEDEDKGGDEDYELRTIREQRLQRLKQEQMAKLENISKGHGQYREIVQDEFLAEVTNSLYVISHFYHRDFQRCTVMDHHLAKLAPNHVETKFIKVNAEKTPFFVEKLKIRTIPTLILFKDGVAIDKIIGFEGLSDTMPVGKEDEWTSATLARLLASKGVLNRKNIKDEERDIEAKQEQLGNLRKAMLNHALDDDLDELLNDD